MNKAELIKSVSGKTGFTNVDSEKVLNAIIGTIIESVASGDVVKLVGFGSFESRSRAERKARNPRTGEEVIVKAKQVPMFKAGKEFKDAVDKE